MRRFWIWYDKLNEPWRLFLCLFLVAIGTGAIGFGAGVQNPHLKFGLRLGGWAFLFFLILSRIRSLNKEGKSKGFKISGRRL